MGHYFFRILCCALISSICLSLFPEGKTRGMVRIFAGGLLILTMLRPDVSVELPDLEGMLWEYRYQAQSAASAGEDYARYQRRQFIIEAIEAYILDKGNALGCYLTVTVELDAEGYPATVVLSGSATEEAKRNLEALLQDELGIAKEDQQWIGDGIPQASENG